MPKGNIAILHKHKLYAKQGKCDILQLEIHYLGHVILKGRVIVDPEKIKDIMDWLNPQNVTQMLMGKNCIENGKGISMVQRSN